MDVSRRVYFPPIHPTTKAKSGHGKKYTSSTAADEMVLKFSAKKRQLCLSQVTSSIPDMYLQTKMPMILDRDNDMYPLLVDSWIKAYINEKEGFVSTALFCEVKLKELLNITGNSIMFKSVRTAVCIDLFDTLVSSLGSIQLQELFIELRNDILLSIYDTDKNSLPIMNINNLKHNTHKNVVYELLKQQEFFKIIPDKFQRTKNRKAQVHSLMIPSRTYKLRNIQKRMTFSMTQKWARVLLTWVFWEWKVEAQGRKEARLCTNKYHNILSNLIKKGHRRILKKRMISWRIYTHRRKNTRYSIQLSENEQINYELNEGKNSNEKILNNNKNELLSIKDKYNNRINDINIQKQQLELAEDRLITISQKVSLSRKLLDTLIIPLVQSIKTTEVLFHLWRTQEEVCRFNILPGFEAIGNISKVSLLRDDLYDKIITGWTNTQLLLYKKNKGTSLIIGNNDNNNNNNDNNGKHKRRGSGTLSSSSSNINRRLRSRRKSHSLNNTNNTSNIMWEVDNVGKDLLNSSTRKILLEAIGNINSINDDNDKEKDNIKDNDDNDNKIQEELHINEYSKLISKNIPSYYLLQNITDHSLEEEIKATIVCLLSADKYFNKTLCMKDSDLLVLEEAQRINLLNLVSVSTPLNPSSLEHGIMTHNADSIIELKKLKSHIQLAINTSKNVQCKGVINDYIFRDNINDMYSQSLIDLRKVCRKTQELLLDEMTLKAGTIFSRKYFEDIIDFTSNNNNNNIDVNDIEEIFHELLSKLKPIFNYYTSGSKTMNNNQFARFVRGSRLQLNEPGVGELIFLASSYSKKQADVLVEIDYTCWCRSIIRLSIMKYPSSSSSSNENNITLFQKVKNILNDYILPNASKSADNPSFFESLSSPETESVFHRHDILLRKIFHAYGQAGESGSSGFIISWNGLLSLCKDYNVCIANSYMNVKECENIFTSVCSSDAKSIKALSYYEYLEFLTAVSCFVVRNPYFALHTKLERFICDVLASKKIRSGRI